MNQMQTRAFALDLKAVSESGTFEGYASIFGNTDTYGEIVEPGAFGKSLAKHKREGTSPLMLWQHDGDYPIGVWDDLAEDGKGLYCKGSLLKGVQKADEAHIILKAKAIRGLSIGYRTVDSEQDGAVVRLKEIDLYEISPCSFPANRRARVEAVKQERIEDFARRLRDGEPPTIKEFEDLLRDVGIPKSMAVAIASHGYVKAIRSDSGGDEAKAAMAEALASLRSIPKP